MRKPTGIQKTAGILTLLCLLLSGCGTPKAQPVPPAAPVIPTLNLPTPSVTTATPVITEPPVLAEPPEFWKLDYGMFLLSLYSQLENPHYILNDADADGIPELFVSSGYTRRLYTADASNAAFRISEATGATGTSDFYIDTQTGRILQGVVYGSMSYYHERYSGWDGSGWREVFAYSPANITETEVVTKNFAYRPEDIQQDGAWFYGPGGSYDYTAKPQSIASLPKPDLLNIFFRGQPQFLFKQCEQYFKDNPGYMDCLYGDLSGDGVFEQVLLISAAADPFWDNLQIDSSRNPHAGMFHEKCIFAIVGTPSTDGATFYPCILTSYYDDTAFSVESGVLKPSLDYDLGYEVDFSQPNTFGNNIFVSAKRRSESRFTQARIQANPPSTISIDLSVPETYKKMNTFLSNFSETRFGATSNFYADSPSKAELVHFAAIQNFWNNYKVIGRDFPENVYYPDGFRCGYRISKEAVNKTLTRFFGKELGPMDDSETLEIEMGDYYYWDSTGGDRPCGITLAETVTDLGANLFRVDFRSYYAHDYYDATNSDYYSIPLAQAEQMIPYECYCPSYGRAVIQAVAQEDGTITFYLLEYERDYNY